MLRESVGEIAEAADAVVALSERQSNCSNVLLSRPSCGETSRSANTFSARLTSATAPSMGWVALPWLRGRSLLPRPARVAGTAIRHHVLVGDELGAVLLHHLAGEGASADHEHLAVVLLQFDQGDEVAVAADDDEGVDVGVGERHFEGVEREVDVGAVLVAAGGRHALHEANGVCDIARP